MIDLNEEIVIYVTLRDYEEALTEGIEAEYYLTLQDLYECEGDYVPHVELLMPNWLPLDSNCIDISTLKLN